DIIGAKLAITSSIKLDGLNKKDVLFHIYRLLSNIAPNELLKLGLQPLDKDEDIYQELLKYGQNNKMLLKNNEVDINKVI
ncbi:GTP binding domain protein, partial [Chlamydia psittaci 01DC11]